MPAHVRAATREELDDFVAVLCEAFDLAFEPAREIVLRDPYFDLNRKRVLVGPDNRILSCLTVVDQRMWIGESVVPVAGIAGVATRASHRGQGLASRLLRETMEWLRGEGYGLAALLAADPRCYAKLGWAYAGRHVRLSTPARAVPASAERMLVRPATRADIPAITHLYDEASRGVSGCCLRDRKRWDALWQQTRDRRVYDSGTIEGYAISERREVDGEERLVVAEVVARSERARAGLAAALALRAEGAELRYDGGLRSVEASGLLVAEARMDVLPGAMYRVLDLERVLAHLLPNLQGWRGRVVCRMLDGVAAHGVCVEGDGSRVTVRPAEAAEHSDLEGDASAWSVLAPGGKSLEVACADGTISPRSSEVVRAAAALFPQRDPAIPVLDYF